MWRTLKREIAQSARIFVMNSLIGSPLVIPEVRAIMLQWLGFQTGRARIKSRVFFGSNKIRIGSSSFVNVGVFFDGSAQISVGENCSIGYEAMFVASSHEIGTPRRRAGTDVSRPVVVEDGVWIGARAVVLGGVRINSGCVIAAGSVVIRDCAPNGLYAGVPARRIRELDSKGEVR